MPATRSDAFESAINIIKLRILEREKIHTLQPHSTVQPQSESDIDELCRIASNMIVEQSSGMSTEILDRRQAAWNVSAAFMAAANVCSSAEGSAKLKRLGTAFPALSTNEQDSLILRAAHTFLHFKKTNDILRGLAMMSDKGLSATKLIDADKPISELVPRIYPVVSILMIICFFSVPDFVLKQEQIRYLPPIPVRNSFGPAQSQPAFLGSKHGSRHWHAQVLM